MSFKCDIFKQKINIQNKCRSRWLKLPDNLRFVIDPVLRSQYFVLTLKQIPIVSSLPTVP